MWKQNGNHTGNGRTITAAYLSRFLIGATRCSVTRKMVYALTETDIERLSFKVLREKWVCSVSSARNT